MVGGWLAGWLGRQHSYGQEFLQNTYGYHFTRTDVRHNFALWFLPQYVAHQSSHILARVHMLASAAQVVATAGLGIRFHSNVPFAVAAQALAFVAFNRVITAQYYVWVIAVLPLALVQCKVPSWLFALWLATEVRRLRLQGLRGRCLCLFISPPMCHVFVARCCLCPLGLLPGALAAMGVPRGVPWRGRVSAAVGCMHVTLRCHSRFVGVYDSDTTSQWALAGMHSCQIKRKRLLDRSTDGIGGAEGGGARKKKTAYKYPGSNWGPSPC